ncbi:tumor necrosis factor ligand superfamily member 8 [Lissotriton helveticus]
MEQVEGNVPRSQRHIIRVLCCITAVSCSACLLLTATSLVVFLYHKAGPMTAENKGNHEPLKTSCMKRQDADFPQNLMDLLLPRKTTVAQLQLAKGQNYAQKMMWNSDGILENIDYQEGDLVIKTPGFYFVYCHLHFKRTCEGDSIDLRIELRVNGKLGHQTIHTCKPESSSEKVYISKFFGAVFSLRTNDSVSVTTDWADFVDTKIMIGNNVFGTFTLH